MELSIFKNTLVVQVITLGFRLKEDQYCLYYLTSCSRLLYSPSVFSLMIMMSMFLWRVMTPGSDRQCITLANKSKLVLVWKHRAETTAHVTTKTKHGLCQGFGDQFKTLTEGGYFWIWQKVASYVWFLCYLLWNNITVVASHLGSPFMISMKDRKNSLSTFEGDPVSADGSDGIIDVVLTLQGRVDVYYLKVHRNTAEPAEKMHKPHTEPS